MWTRTDLASNSAQQRPPLQLRPLLLAAALLVSTTGHAEEWTVDQWEQAVYYRHTFNAPEEGSALLRLTAVNEYEVFLNGEAIGSDDNWTTMEEYPVELKRRKNELAVRVVNRGRGNGNGLVVEVSAAEQSWVSTFGALQDLWYWSGEPQEDAGWLTTNVSRLDAWQQVQRGQLDRTGVSGWSDTVKADVIAGFPGGIDIGQPAGGLSLRPVEGENLAFRLPSNRPEVFDGRSNTGWTVDPTELNAIAQVDLLNRRLISEVRVLTQGRNADEFVQNTLRGYAVQVSNDQFGWSEVGVLHGIDQPERTAIAFAPIFARYLQVIIAEVDAVQRAKVAEIQVLGSGVASAGSFVSPPLDLGRPGERKNFTSVRWSGQVPDGTALGLQFRSSNDGSTWSDWSAPVHTSPTLLQVPEPRTLLQYRVNMETQFEDMGPRLDSLIVDFTDQVPASLVRGWIEPNRVVLGRDTLFTYRLELDFSADDLGVERVRVALPSQIELEEIVPPPGVEIAATTASSTALDLVLAEPWHQAGTLEMRFRGRLLSNAFQFRAQVSGPDGDATQDAEENIEPDPDSGQPRSWQVSASGVEGGGLLSQVRPVPQAFSPNGDGINDATVIEFTLARVSEPQVVAVDIFDVQGRPVRALYAAALSAGEYVRLPSAPTSVPGLWDGRDDAGELVAPGFYLVRVRILLEREEESRLCAVAVVY